MWEEAKAKNEERVKQLAKGGGDEEEEIERPLPKEIHRSLMDNHEEKWGFRLSQDELMWAHLLGRMKRERDKSGETLLEIDRVGTATEGGVSPGAKTMSHADPALKTTYKSWAGTTREVPDNFLFMKLFEALGSVLLLFVLFPSSVSSSSLL